MQIKMTTVIAETIRANEEADREREAASRRSRYQRNQAFRAELHREYVERYGS